MALSRLVIVRHPVTPAAEPLERRVVLSTAIAVGTEFLVNEHTDLSQRFPSVAMDADGDFVIAWSGVGQADPYDVFAQRYSAAGVPQGGEFRVNGYTTGAQLNPAVAMTEGGNFVVVAGEELLG